MGARRNVDRLQPGQRAIWTVPADGSDPVAIADEDGLAPAWQPLPSTVGRTARRRRGHRTQQRPSSRTLDALGSATVWFGTVALSGLNELGTRITFAGDWRVIAVLSEAVDVAQSSDDLPHPEVEPYQIITVE